MVQHVRIQRPLCVVVAGLLLGFSVAGCGKATDRPETVSVSGKVTYKGEPLKNGRVKFTPDDPKARPAVGDIDANGNYTLTTYELGDGALVGSYKISIDAYDPNADDPDDLDAKLKMLIPKKYSNPATSELVATISESDGSKQIDLELEGEL